MKTLLVALGIVASSPLALAAPLPVRTHVLPGATAFPESIAADPRTGWFYTGSVGDGTLFRGRLDQPNATVLLPAGSDGRTSVAGVKIDRRGRLWLADAFNGRVLVYSQQGALLHAFTLTGPGVPTVNDIAFSHGVAYVTDSSRPFLYRIAEVDAATPGTSTVTPWIDVSSHVTYASGAGPLGVNLNGIVASPSGHALLAIQTNTGILFRIDTRSNAIAPVTVDGGSLRFGDGMLRQGNRLLIARNAVDEIVTLHLGRGYRTATVVYTLVDERLAFPTALARLEGRLLVTNAQLDAGSNPALPFTVLDMPQGGW
jgi:superoxide dismutase, Cu-Zn family